MTPSSCDMDDSVIVRHVRHTIPRMPLDPQAQTLLDMLAQMPQVPMAKQTPEASRAPFGRLAAMSGEPDQVANVEDRTIPGPAGEIPVRIYTPEGSGPFPIL